MIKNILALVLLSAFSISSVLAGGIPFLNKAVIAGGDTQITSGTLYGLETGPTGGKYEAFITNGKSFKGDTFSTMKCTVHKELADPMASKFKNVATLSTTYYEKDGNVTTATGYIAGMTAMPENGYTVIVKNKAKNNVWNLLKCTIR